VSIVGPQEDFSGSRSTGELLKAEGGSSVRLRKLSSEGGETQLARFAGTYTFETTTVVPNDAKRAAAFGGGLSKKGSPAGQEKGSLTLKSSAIQRGFGQAMPI